MHPAVWKVLSGILLGCVLVQQFDRWQTPLRRHHPFRADNHGPLHHHPHPHEHDSGSFSSPDIEAWEYDWERDGNTQGLNTEQCNSAFPELYREIERSTAYW